MKRTALLPAFTLGLWALGTGLQAAPRYFDLSKAANMGPAESFDEAAPGIQDLHQKSGLEYLPSGPQTFRGVPFQLLNPASNNGHSYVVLKGRRKPGFPAAVSIPGDHQKAAYLYFLHTCRWGGTASNITVAEYDIVYDDGKVEVIPLHVGAELTNFWGADDTAASSLAWWYKYKNSEMGISLYGWKNPRPEEPIQSILFKSPGKMPVPILFAITASDKELSVSSQSPKPEKTFQTDTKNWIPLDATAGSPTGTALDMSFLMDAPAGKHGAVKAQGDKLVFEDGTSVRFWGTTLSQGWSTWDNDQQKRALDRLVASGCNLVLLDISKEIGSEPHSALKPGPYAIFDQLRQRGIYVLFLKSWIGEKTVSPLQGILPGLSPASKPDAIGDNLWNQFSWDPWGKSSQAAGTEALLEKDKVPYRDTPICMRPLDGQVSEIISRRVLGKPYIARWTGEWPNEYEGEMPLLMSAFAGLQGWDGSEGVWISGEDGTGRLDRGANLENDPLLRIQWPVAALAYLRGDLREGKIHVLDPKGDLSDTTAVLKALAHRSGLSDGIIKTDRAGELKAKINEKTNSFISDTGQISWQGNVGIVKIDSPRFQALIGFLGNRKFNNNSWEVETPNSFASLSAISLTKSALPGSDHVLITGVTRMENTGMVYNQAKTKLLDAGKAPILVEPLKTRIVLYRYQQSPNLKVRALDMAGQPLKTKVPVKWVKNSLVLSWVPGAFYLEIAK